MVVLDAECLEDVVGAVDGDAGVAAAFVARDCRLVADVEILLKVGSKADGMQHRRCIMLQNRVFEVRRGGGGGVAEPCRNANATVFSRFLLSTQHSNSHSAPPWATTG